MTEERSPSGATAALIAFAGGALLGAGLALLFAPQSGRKTRGQIGDLAEKAKDLVDEKKTQVASMLDSAHR